MAKYRFYKKRDGKVQVLATLSQGTHPIAKFVSPKVDRDELPAAVVVLAQQVQAERVRRGIVKDTASEPGIAE